MGVEIAAPSRRDSGEADGLNLEAREILKRAGQSASSERNNCPVARPRLRHLKCLD